MRAESWGLFSWPITSALDEGDGAGWAIAETFSENRGGEVMSTATIGDKAVQYYQRSDTMMTKILKRIEMQRDALSAGVRSLSNITSDSRGLGGGWGGGVGVLLIRAYSHISAVRGAATSQILMVTIKISHRDRGVE